MTSTDLPSDSNLPRKSYLSTFSTRWSTIKTTILSLLVFIGQRLAFGALVLLFIIFLTYLGLDMATGSDFSPALQEAIPNSIAYLQRLLTGDLGMTTAGSDTYIPRPVTEVLRERLIRSLGLLGASLLFASLVGISLGILGARSRSQRSLGILVLTIIGISIPSFFAAFLLQWAFTSITRRVGQPILPVGGFGWDAHIILPMLVLAARPIAQITRMTFVAIRQILGKDYVRTAYSKGLHRYQIMTVHVMRNAAIPILTTIGVSLRFALSSLPVVELYFGWTGVGVTLLKGIARQDTNLVIGLTLCLGVFFILVNLLLELSYRFIDPRLKSKPEHISSVERTNPLVSIKNAWAGLLDLLANNPVTNLFKRHQPHSQDRELYNIAVLNQNKPTEAPAVSSSMRGAWLAVLRNLPLVVGGLMVAGLLTILIFGPSLAPNNPYYTHGLVYVDGQFMTPPFPPNETYPLGTDALGRGILSLLLAGAQQTLTLALLAVASRLLVGILLGALAGWFNDSFLDRVVVGLAEVISAFPTLLITMILILAIGIRQGMQAFVIALCFVGWGEIMQYVRSEVISIRPRLFIESAIATGARTWRIITRHVLPILFSAIVSMAALEMSAVLMLLGELGFISIFIGGGARIALAWLQTIQYSDVPEWGAMLSDIRFLVRSYPWTGLYPMLAFFVTILSFNLFGEGIRRMVDEGNPLLNRLINRYTILMIVVAVLGYNWVSSNFGAMPFYRNQANQFNRERALYHTSILSHPRMFGRALGTPGSDLASIYIGINFKELGLQPGGENSSFYQKRLRSFEILNSEPVFTIDDGDLQPNNGSDFATYPGFNMSLGEASAPVRFISVGENAGVVTPGGSRYYPELDRADFSGEILFTLTDREVFHLSHVSSDGILVLTKEPTLLKKRFTLSGNSAIYINPADGQTHGKDIPYIWISEQTANRLLTPTGYTVEKLSELADEHNVDQIFDIPVETNIAMVVEGNLIEKWPVNNVIGLWPGTEGYDFCVDCLGKKLIVVVTQYDSPPIGPEGIFPAADDNASGVAVLLEAIRVMKETGYQPYKSFLFVAYSGEGLDNGQRVDETYISKILKANSAFSNFEIEAIIYLRGLGGTGERLEISAGGSLRLADLFDTAAKNMGVDTVRSSDPIDISAIYDEGSSALEGSQEAPIVKIYREGWDQHSRCATDSLDNISLVALDEAGRTISLSLMILGRETNY